MLLESHCTTVPDLIQRQTTLIAVTATGDLGQLTKQAEAAMKLCRDKNPDPRTPCAEATQILGVS